MLTLRGGLLLALTALSTGAPASVVAQAWASVPSGMADTRIAASIWGDQTRIVARCDAGRLTAFVSRALPLPGAVVFVLTQRRPDDPKGAWWRLSEDGLSVVARRPIGFVRDLRKGGVLDVVVKSRDAPDWETTLSLPTDTSELDAVMAACGMSIQPPEPITPPVSLRWSTVPRPTARDYPPGALDEGLSGIASISCGVNLEGIPQDCIVLDEAPLRWGFGMAAAAIVERGRLKVDPSAFDENVTPVFNTTVPFKMERRDAPDLPFIQRIETETEGMFPEQTPQEE